MAQRRMFSKQIVQTDAFLDMPPTTQLLYFHLNMEADDDGFVSSHKKIMKILGSNEDDLKILFAKRFLLPFQSGVCVVKHWLIHNYIRKDTYTETRYIDEKSALQVKDNGSYTERPRPVDVPLTQVRLGKVRLGKKEDATKVAYGEFKKVLLTEEEHNKLVEKIGDKNTDLMIVELDTYLASKNKKYSSHYATLLNWVRRKIVDHKKTKSNVAF